MHPDRVYNYPIWVVGMLMAGGAVLGAVAIELTVRRFVPFDLRRQHNDVAAAMFAIIGVTYAVLLAFVAMLAWDGFNKAKAASYTEAAVVLDVYNVSVGLAAPQKEALRSDIIGYLRQVVTAEWPAQAEGRTIDPDSTYIDRLNDAAAAMHPANATDADLHVLLLQALIRLEDARQDRLLAAESTIPGIVWFVMLLGGALTVAFGSFLGAPSLRMHLAMSATLAISGSLVVIMIIALSNPFRGDFRVSTAPFDQVMSRIGSAPSP
jgi:hypothetical protein